MEFIRKHYKLILYSIPLISFAFHFYVFHLDLVGIHVWRQTETQTVINNFWREDMNILHPRVNNLAYPDRLILLEFPVMQWIFAVFFKMFGPHVIISRILSFILGLFSAYGIFYFCNNIFKNKAMAAISAWCFSFSPVFYYYTMNPMPDNMALCFSIWSLGFSHSYINTARMKYVVLSALCIGVSVLCKLPFILFSSFIITFFITRLKYKETTVKHLLTVIAIYLLFAVPAVLWYASVMYSWKGMVVLKGIFDTKQSAYEMLQILVGILVSSLPELLINYGSVLFFVAAFYFIYKTKVYLKKYFLLFAVWGIVIILYFIFEMNTINIVHDYYLFPFLPPIFILVGYGAYNLLSVKARFIRVASVCLLAILPVTAFIRAYSRWDVATDTGFNKTFYMYKNELRSLTPPNALCVVGSDQSDMVLLYYIDHKGWSFNDDKLDGNLLSEYIHDGAQYLYSASNVDNKPDIKAHLGEKLFDKENLRVYKLK